MHFNLHSFDILSHYLVPGRHVSPDPFLQVSYKCCVSIYSSEVFLQLLDDRQDLSGCWAFFSGNTERAGVQNLHQPDEVFCLGEITICQPIKPVYSSKYRFFFVSLNKSSAI